MPSRPSPLRRSAASRRESGLLVKHPERAEPPLQSADMDALIIGAGQAGLGIGYHLRAAGLKALILERGQIGETWRNQRWDSFAVNTPNWMNGLPGSPYRGKDPDGFYLRDELVAVFERYATEHVLPIRTGVTVSRVTRLDGSSSFMIETVDQLGRRETLESPNVVVASGLMQAPKFPAIAGSLPEPPLQIHAAEFRSAAGLPDGSVLIVGSGQSGCQIAEDLLDAGRTVYLCTSQVGRVPRRYRGRDTLEWMQELGLWDQTTADLPDPAMEFAPQPQVSGVGRLGRTVSLQSLHGRGVKLMGRLKGIEGATVLSDDTLAAHLAFADEFSAELKTKIDEHIESRGLDAPPAEVDPTDLPAGPEVAQTGLTELDLAAAGVTTIVWCTGFTSNLDWLELPVFDEFGRPIHRRGVSPIPGLFFLGFPWLHTRKSGIIFGIDEDARHLADAIVSRRA